MCYWCCCILISVSFIRRAVIRMELNKNKNNSVADMNV